MLHLQNISKSFESNKVINDLNVTIKKGDFIILIGANKSGRSTLLQLISGSLSPDTGTIAIHGNDITNTNEQVRTEWISQLFQNPNDNTIAHMTVAENLALAAMKERTLSLKPGSESCCEQDISEIETQYGIDLQPLLQQKMEELSEGQQRLLAFIMTTMHTPELLLMDEPTAALDPQEATMFLTSVHRYIKDHDMTAILVTQDPQLAITLGNKVWVLKDGRLQQYNEQEKKSLSPENLVGHIDYEQIKTS